MSVNWHTRVKKLALAYETGWEYVAGSDEAGSVLTDVFLEMAGRNRGRFGGIWKKHEREFLQAAPFGDEVAKRLRSAIVIKASKGDDDKYLKEGTAAYTILKEGRLVRFRTCSGLTLTSAALRYAVLKKGLSEWLIYDSRAELKTGLCGFADRLFQGELRELACPAFEWGFDGLCDGRKRLSFILELGGGVKADSGIGQRGSWTVTDGQQVYPLLLERTEDAFVLSGETPEFERRLDGEGYVLRLELPAGEEPGQGWQEALCEDIILREAPAVLEPELCLTEAGAEDVWGVRPFGRAVLEASCCYFACDGAAAGREGEIVLRFTEEFETEEKLPEPPSKEYEKLYAKYPWIKREETVQEWQAQDTVWEYFNGSLWRPLPESGTWETGGRPGKTGERVYRWSRPRDMRPCSIEGEPHFYIRLRLVCVRNAYAPYYRKYIPVMKDVRFETGERSFRPVMRRLPQRAEWQESKIFLGFDGRVTPQASWYTGKESLSFSWEQLVGQETRHGMEAFWVELEDGRAREWRFLVPNYVGLLQETVPEETVYEEPTNPYLKIRAATEFSVETDNGEVLDAVSVWDSRYNGDGPPVEEHMRADAAKHYFSHYGRLVTFYDMELFIQERYPFLKAVSCSLPEAAKELQVALKTDAAFQGSKAELLSEIDEWLQETVSRTGPLWLRGISVRCTLA